MAKLTGIKLVEERKKALKGQEAIKKASAQGAFDISKAKAKPTLNKLISDRGKNPGAAEFLRQGGSQDEVNAYYNQVPEISPITDEEKAQSLLDQERKDQREAEFNLSGKTVTPKSQEKENELFNRKQERKKTELEQRITELNRLDFAQFEQQKQRGEAAKAATTETFAQGREGVASDTSPLISKQFSRRVNQQIDDANSRLQLQFQNRDNLMRDLKEAQDQNLVDKAKSIRKDLASAENIIDQVQLDLANAQAENTKLAFDFLDSSPGGTFEGMNIEDIMAMTGVGAGTANYMRVTDANKASIELNDPERLYKLAQINKMNIEAQWAGMPNSAKEFLAYQDILQRNPAEAAKYAVQIGITNDPTALEMAKTAQIDAETAANYFKRTGSSLPTNSKYSYSTTNNGVTWTGLITDDVCGTRWECAEMVNDALGTPNLFTDYFTEKKAIAKDKFGVAGGAFVENTGDQYGHGHVGLIESINPDGSLNVVDSNYRKNKNGEGIISRTTIAKGSERWNKIVGYYSPESVDSEQLEIDTRANEWISRGLDRDDAYLKADEEIKAEDKNLKTVDLQVSGNQVAIDTVDKILADVLSFGGTGGGPIRRTVGQIIPGREAFDIAANLDTVKAVVGFAKLQAMREASKTGGALGQVSEMENILLQSVLGSMNVGQSNEQFVKNLLQVKRSLIKLNYASALDANKDIAQTFNLKTSDKPEDIKRIYNQLSTDKQQGADDYDLIVALIEQGIDPTPFFN